MEEPFHECQWLWCISLGLCRLLLGNQHETSKHNYIIIPVWTTVTYDSCIREAYLNAIVGMFGPCRQEEGKVEIPITQTHIAEVDKDSSGVSTYSFCSQSWHRPMTILFCIVPCAYILCSYALDLTGSVQHELICIQRPTNTAVLPQVLLIKWMGLTGNELVITINNGFISATIHMLWSLIIYGG